MQGSITPVLPPYLSTIQVRVRVICFGLKTRRSFLNLRLFWAKFELIALPRINNAAKMTPSWCCRNSAAKLAASWARLTKLAASMVHIYQTCSKYGSPSHTWRIFGSATKFAHFRQHWQHGQFRQFNKRRGQACKPYDERHFSPTTKRFLPVVWISCDMDTPGNVVC